MFKPIKKIFFISICFFLTNSIYSQNLTEIDSLVTLLKTTSDTTKINILNALSEKYLTINIDKSLSYANQAREIAQNMSNELYLGKSFLNIARAYHSKSENEKALLYLNKAFLIFEDKKAVELLSNTYNAYANLYADVANYKKALNYNLKALKIREEINDLAGASSSLINIGRVYYTLGNLEKAKEYYFKSLDIKEKIGDLDGLGSCYNNLANVAIDKKEYNQALQYLEKALDIKTKVGNKRGTSYALNGFGTVYSALKNYSKAREYYIKSYEIKKELSDHRGIAGAVSNIGTTYFFSGNYEDAIKYFKIGVEEAEIAGAKDIKLSFHQNIAESYLKLKEYKNAAEAYANVLDLKDSILSIETAKSMQEMQSKFDFEKQEKEIKILKQEKEIQALDVERTKLIKNGFIVGFVLLLLIAFVIFNRYQVKQKANAKLESQKQEIVRQHHELNIAYGQIETKNKDITDSIKYAKRLQEAILPIADFQKQFSQNAFIFYKPKDIVSGDFYWMVKKENKVLVAAVDCTGHGVPGAFMSIVGYNVLNQAVNEHNLTVPSEILNELNRGITNTLRQYETESTVKDGMDIALCCINTDTLEVEYAGAYNPLWIIKGNKFEELSADKFPIGAFVGEKINQFSNQKIQMTKGDMIYMFTDGYADQFGGPKGKKFKYKQLQQLIIDNKDKSMIEQKRTLESAFTHWIGNYEQVDDVLVIGIKL
jgi:serine phosphatase RsbU (regulator of sigma subunit)